MTKSFFVDWTDANLQKFIDEWMLVKFPPPFDEVKELLIELALRVRQIRELAKTNYEEHDGLRWVRADDLLAILDN